MGTTFPRDESWGEWEKSNKNIFNSESDSSYSQSDLSD